MNHYLNSNLPDHKFPEITPIKTKAVSVRLSEDLKRQGQRKASEEGRRISSLMRYLLEMYLKEKNLF